MFPEFRAVVQFCLARWDALRLSQRFTIGSLAVLLVGMLLIGSWVSKRIALAVTENSAHAAALYMEGTVGPIVEELATRNELSPIAIDRLDALIKQSAIRESIISLKVWRADGTIAYSPWRDMIGKAFPQSKSFKKALSGGVAAEFNNEPHQEDSNERAGGHPMLEIYAPVRSAADRSVIAVSEFYANGEKLEKDLKQATFLSWLVVGAVTFCMFAALSGIVHGGSRTIELQQVQLANQISELKLLLEQNVELRQRLQQASAAATELNEQVLQRIGADLHDGPAQLLTYALLRLKKFAPMIQANGASGVTELSEMQTALRSTLDEVRNISAGLTIPGLDTATLEEAIGMVVTRHRERTGTDVQLVLKDLPRTVSQALKVCIYRVIQESLTNATRHGGGVEQLVVAEGGPRLEIVVSDMGGGFVGDAAAGLGLTGMRARVEALGGELVIDGKVHSGTRVIARFNRQETSGRDAG